MRWAMCRRQAWFMHSEWIDGVILRPMMDAGYTAWRGGERLGLLARLRDVLPGQVAIGLTGRDPDGNRLAPGPYRIKLVAVPTTGRPITRKVVKFRIK